LEQVANSDVALKFTKRPEPLANKSTTLWNAFSTMSVTVRSKNHSVIAIAAIGQASEIVVLLESQYKNPQ
jgi:hypothetical protein